VSAFALALNPAAQPRVYTLPPHVAFADAIAKHFLDHTNADDPLALARTQILLPNQRGARALSDAFLRASVGALLLPRLAPIGDTDDIEDMALLGPDADLSLPPAIDPLDRLLALTPLVEKWGAQTRGRAFSAAEALRYARALAQVIDQFDYAQVDPSALGELVGGDLAVHWQQTRQFLDIIFDYWPAELKRRGLMNPAARRVMLLGQLAERWRETPPLRPVLIAGSTGTIPVVAQLMQVTARLSQGAVLLPGLDRDLPEDAWSTLAKSHPQYALKQALERMGVNRAEVMDWPHAAPGRQAAARTAFTHRALWPPELTAAWRDSPAGEIGSMTFMEAASDTQEAMAIALVVREALETPEQRIAVVTGDRPLARRIAAHLRRYGITIDDSAGQSLSLTPPAVFLRQLALCAQTGCAPLELLALLKHPLCQAGGARRNWLRGVRILDARVLRGLRPAAGITGLENAMAAQRQDPRGGGSAALDLVGPVIATLKAALGPLEDLAEESAVPARDSIDAHLTALAALAGDDLWRGAAGSALAIFLDTLHSALPETFQLSPDDFPAWLDALLAPEVIRPRFGRHPRVALLSPIEARLQQSDVVILAGLNEGSWPPTASTDPFLADHMRSSLGLPTSEFRLGQAAHDFAQGLGAPTVFLSRARKSNDAPTLASRLWLRALACRDDDVGTAGPIALAQLLDVPLHVRPCLAPRPTAPKSAWPTTVSVSDMALWRQNPFAYHAKKILKLKPLDDLDADPGAADRGTMLHAALEYFFKLAPEQRARDAFMNIGAEVFAPILARPLVRAVWLPRFEALVEAVLGSDLMCDDTVTLYLEEDGRWPLRDIIITGRADRIERSAEGMISIYDYKSGGSATGPQIIAARAPQLALLGLMAQHGLFKGIPASPVGELGFVSIKGSLREPLKIERLSKKQKMVPMADLLNTTAGILNDWVALFENPAAPYNYLTDRNGTTLGADYDHLARVAEWRDTK
jgi:ATP-dependent helicase/nuclease subunit B